MGIDHSCKKHAFDRRCRTGCIFLVQPFACPTSIVDSPSLDRTISFLCKEKQSSLSFLPLAFGHISDVDRCETVTFVQLIHLLLGCFLSTFAKDLQSFLQNELLSECIPVFTKHVAKSLHEHCPYWCPICLVFQIHPCHLVTRVFFSVTKDIMSVL